MDNFTPDESQLKALATWYDKSNPLHFDPRHPCIKLAGEAGELLDLYAKDEYKPNFSWWECKVCTFMPADKRRSETDYFAYTCMNGKTHTPKVLDELGDVSYYLRILTYIKGVSFEAVCGEYDSIAIQMYYSRGDLLATLSDLSLSSNILLARYLANGNINGTIRDCTFYFLAILHKLDCSLEKLLDLNYRKLNSEESHHGWRDATIKSRA